MSVGNTRSPMLSRLRMVVPLNRTGPYGHRRSTGRVAPTASRAGSVGQVGRNQHQESPLSDIPVAIRNGCDGRPGREQILRAVTRDAILLAQCSTIALTLIAVEATCGRQRAVDPGTRTPRSACGPLAPCGTVP